MFQVSECFASSFLCFALFFFVLFLAFSLLLLFQEATNEYSGSRVQQQQWMKNFFRFSLVLDIRRKRIKKTAAAVVERRKRRKRSGKTNKLLNNMKNVCMRKEWKFMMANCLKMKTNSQRIIFLLWNDTKAMGQKKGERKRKYPLIKPASLAFNYCRFEWKMLAMATENWAPFTSNDLLKVTAENSSLPFTLL